MTKQRLYAHFWKFENRKVKREESKNFPQYYLPATRIVMCACHLLWGRYRCIVVHATGRLGAVPLHGSQHLVVLSRQHPVPEGGWRGRACPPGLRLLARTAKGLGDGTQSPRLGGCGVGRVAHRRKPPLHRWWHHRHLQTRSPGAASTAPTLR